MVEEKLLKYSDYEPDDEGREQAVRQIHYQMHGMAPPRVPPRIRPSVVESVLMDEVKPGLKPAEIRNAGGLARFYRTTPAVEKFAGLLQRREGGTDGVLGSLFAIRVVADLGTREQIANAEQYYAYLLRQNPLEDFADGAIECFFDMPESVKAKQVEEALEKQIEALKKRKDDPARDAQNALEMHLTITLPIVDEARTRKNKMLAEPNPKLRTTALASAYIGIDDPGGVEWRVWGSYALREELIKSGDAALVTAFHAAAETIPADDEAAAADMRAAAVRAIAYFGGALTEKQKEWLAPDKVAPLPLEG